MFNDTETTEIYTLSLHAALPISARRRPPASPRSRLPESSSRSPISRPPYGPRRRGRASRPAPSPARPVPRSEEHTSELQSRQYLVCRLLLEKKKISSQSTTCCLD